MTDKLTIATQKLTIAPAPKLNDNAFEPFSVLFNPNTYSISKSVSWSTPTSDSCASEPTNRLRDAPELEFGGGGARLLRLELFFDTTEKTDQIDAREDVRKLTNKIVALTQIVPKLQRPPVCVVSWGDPPHGSDFPFRGVVTDLTQSFTLFLANGRPVRANLTVAFTEYLVGEENDRKNDPEFTTRLVRRSDTLSSIAGDVYGDPTSWRIIAEENDIDDPRQGLEPFISKGQRLSIPKVG